MENHNTVYNLFQSAFSVCWCWRSEDAEAEMVPVFRVSDQYPLHGFHLRVWPGFAGGQEDQQGPGVQEHLRYHHKQQDIRENLSHPVPKQDWSPCSESSSQWHSSLLSRVRVSISDIWKGKTFTLFCYFRDVASVSKYSPGFKGNPRSIEDVKKFLLSYFLSSKRYFPCILSLCCSHSAPLGFRRGLSTTTLPLQ